MKKTIYINKFTAAVPAASRGQFNVAKANKASAQEMNQETSLKYSTGCRSLRDANIFKINQGEASLREASSFISAIYAKKNSHSIVNKLQEIYDLNNSQIIEGNLPGLAEPTQLV